MIIQLLAYAGWKRHREESAPDLHGMNRAGIYAGLAVSANPVTCYSPHSRMPHAKRCNHPSTSVYNGLPFPVYKPIHDPAGVAERAAVRLMNKVF